MQLWYLFWVWFSFIFSDIRDVRNVDVFLENYRILSKQKGRFSDNRKRGLYVVRLYRSVSTCSIKLWKHSQAPHLSTFWVRMKILFPKLIQSGLIWPIICTAMFTLSTCSRWESSNTEKIDSDCHLVFMKMTQWGLVIPSF